MPSQRRVLVIDRHYHFHDRWVQELGSGFRLDVVADVDDAIYTLEQHPGFCAIGIDALIEKSRVVALDHIDHLRKLLQPGRVIVGIAHDNTKREKSHGRRSRSKTRFANPHQIQNDLVRAGCTHYATHLTFPSVLHDALVGALPPLEDTQ